MALRGAPEAFGSIAADAEKLDEAEWRRRLAQRAVFLAEDSSQRAGLAAGIGGDQAGEAELISMWVAPAWRGQGVGDRRGGAVMEWAAGGGVMTVGLWGVQR